MNFKPLSSLALAPLAARMGLVAAASAASMAAHAVVVTSTTVIPIPQNIDGVYVNLVTGATSTTAIAGFDIDPYSTGTALAFYWGGSSSPNNGGVANAGLTGFLDLPAGSVIGASSTFSQSAQTAFSTAFQSAGTHVLGVRFLNESTGAVNYGYVTFSVTGSAGFPSSIIGWSYENSGASITVAGAVPEPTTALMMLGGGLALLAAARRKSRA